MKIGTLSLASRPFLLMGIVNVTPDSFSDGGRYAEPESAVRHAETLIAEGADIIDIGGESSRPGAAGISAEEELRRVLPVIEALRARSAHPISVDTTKAVVARRALSAGADMINDISAGRFDCDMLGTVAEAKAAVCLMHMQGTPRDMQCDPRYQDLMGEIHAFLSDAVKRAEEAGVLRDRIVIDPGIGFGKAASDNVTILQRLSLLSAIDRPLLVGTSRKSFIGKVLDVGLEKRLEGSLASLGMAFDHGATIFRVHDVGSSKRFLQMHCALHSRTA